MAITSMNRAWQHMLLLLAAALMSACTVPGMKMGAKAPGADPDDLQSRAELYAITPRLVSRMNQDARAAEARARSAALLPNVDSQYRYLIGAQDVLRIIIWDHPELTNPTNTSNELSGRVVNSDGSFFFPFVGNVPAAGRTVQEVRDMLVRGLGNYLKSPQVDVSVLQYRSQRVHVTGEVRNPGAVPISDVPLNVADAIAAAGGLSPEADLSSVQITRGDSRFTVDLYGLLYEGDVSRNLRLQHGDIVNVPERRWNKVFVLGEVFRPNSIVMPRGRMTLAEALGDSGGVNPLTANSGQIYVLRGSPSDGNKAQIFHLNASSADALVLADRFELRARDVVFVDPVGVVRWARVVNNILPTLDVLRQTINDVSPNYPR